MPRGTPDYSLSDGSCRRDRAGHKVSAYPYPDPRQPIPDRSGIMGFRLGLSVGFRLSPRLVDSQRPSDPTSVDSQQPPLLLRGDGSCLDSASVEPISPNPPISPLSPLPIVPFIDSWSVCSYLGQDFCIGSPDMTDFNIIYEVGRFSLISMCSKPVRSG